MNFELTEEQILIRETAKEFTNTHLLPGVIERDENQQFPKDQIKKLNETRPSTNNLNIINTNVSNDILKEQVD